MHGHDNQTIDFLCFDGDKGLSPARGFSRPEADPKVGQCMLKQGRERRVPGEEMVPGRELGFVGRLCLCTM